MDDNKDTLIISVNDQPEVNLGELDLSKIQTINLEDIIKDWQPLSDNDILTNAVPSVTPSGNLSSVPYLQWPQINSTTVPNSILGQNQYNSVTSNYNYKPFTISSIHESQLKVEGDAEFSGDIRWKGRSLGDMLSTIERRLSILVPDPEKLQHYEALKKAYEHYKTLEALCDKPPKDEDE